MFENLPRLDGTARVEFTINDSSIVVELLGDDAPITAGNFVDLVRRDVYDGLAFHRVIRTPTPFVVQGGDPQGADPNFPVESLGNGGFIDPNTGEERNIPLEIKLEGDDEPTYSTQLGRLAGNPPPDVVLEHERGAIAMARSGDPDSASSQFYFALDEIEFLDGDYAVFGNIVEGLDLIDTIEQGDRITDAEVIEGLESLNILVSEEDFLADSSQYIELIRDFDGNDLGAADSWKSIGSIDVQGDDDIERVLVNPVSGRWATVGADISGLIDFSNYGQGGDTRVVGIYVDPLVEAGVVERNSDFDSQRRFQNDLLTDNLTLIEGSGSKYDKQQPEEFQELQEIYFRVNDGTAVLHAYMHADGNIRYANYQSESDLETFMTANDINSSVWDDFFAG